MLAAGRGDGTFPHADPEADARTIYAITIQVMDDATGRQLHPTRASAVAHVLRFALPALGSVPVAMVASAGSGPVPSRARD